MSKGFVKTTLAVCQQSYGSEKCAICGDPVHIEKYVTNMFCKKHRDQCMGEGLTDATPDLAEDWVNKKRREIWDKEHAKDEPVPKKPIWEMGDSELCTLTDGGPCVLCGGDKGDKPRAWMCKKCYEKLDESERANEWDYIRQETKRRHDKGEALSRGDELCQECIDEGFTAREDLSHGRVIMRTESGPNFFLAMDEAKERKERGRCIYCTQKLISPEPVTEDSRETFASLGSVLKKNSLYPNIDGDYYDMKKVEHGCVRAKARMLHGKDFSTDIRKKYSEEIIKDLGPNVKIDFEYGAVWVTAADSVWQRHNTYWSPEQVMFRKRERWGKDNDYKTDEDLNGEVSQARLDFSPRMWEVSLYNGAATFTKEAGEPLRLGDAVTTNDCGKIVLAAGSRATREND